MSNNWRKNTIEVGKRRACRQIPQCLRPGKDPSPGPLHKPRATQARQQGDLETAQQILGHSSKHTTERHYADVDLSRAAANALQFGGC
ncbi:MAG: hypothetical protein WKF77_31225 [Planctomycetaceae bacterium]